VTDRTVKAILKADVSSLVASMKQAEKATSDFAKNSTKSAGDHKQAWTQLGTGMMVTGAALALGVGLAVKAYADFSKEMSGVQAVSGANAAQMDQLGKAAIKAGADTVFSASEAAKAEGELAKAGVKTSDILGGALLGSLNLASAGGLDLAAAATIAAQSMNIFKLGGQDVSHIADVLAAGANKSAADVGSLGDALKQGGLVAAQTGLHLEDTVGILSMFADSALVGSDAGTSLKQMLMMLNPQSVKAKDAMAAIGFSAYDASGAFVGMESVAQQLKDGLGGLTAEQRAATLTTIFGSDATRAASILYDKGAAGVRDYTAAVNDNGAAQRMASTMLNNLSGDFEQLRGSIDTALIQSGSAGNGVLRDMVQGATSAVNAFGGLPAPLQQGALGIAAVAAASLLAAGGFMTVMPKIAETKKSLEALGLASKLTKANLMSVATGPIGIGLAVLTIAVGVFAKSQMDAKQRSDDLRNSLDQQTGAITDQTRALVAKQMQEDGTLRRATELGVSHNLLTRAYLGESDAVETLRIMAEKADAQAKAGIARTATAAVGTELLTGSTNLFANATTSATDVLARNTQASIDAAHARSSGIAALLGSAAPVASALGAQSAAEKEAADAAAATGDAAGAAVVPTKALEVAEKDLAAAADATKKAHDDLIASITNFGSAMMTARGDARSYEAAIDAAQASVKANGRTLDITTEKGRNNQAALDGIATAALKAAESNLGLAEQNGTLGAATRTVTGDIGKARDAFITQAIAMGMPKAAAAKLATQAGLTRDRVKEITNGLIDLGKQAPKPVVTVLGVAAGLSAVDNLKARLASLKGRNITVSLNARDRIATLTPAGGGYIRGPGTTTSDSIPALVSDKEYVVKAKAVDYYGVDTMHAINSMRFAAGGYVGPRTSSSTPAGGGNTFQTTINEVTDPVGTAQAVARRQAMLASV
jgi:TP901 family phage tail tape measure protein